MANEGQFPKVDGDLLFGSEVNNFFNLYDDIKTYNLSVTDSSSALNFSSINYKYAILIRNVGEVDCYFDLDGTSTTSGMFIEAGAEIHLTSCNFDDLSAITSSGTTTLSIIVFTGYNNTTGYSDSYEILDLSSTDSSSNVSFSNTTDFKNILITNIGANETFIAFDSSATTSDFKLEPKETLTVMCDKYQIAAICNSGEITTIRILGVY